MKGYFIWLLKLLTLVGVFFIVVPLLIVTFVVAAASSVEGNLEGALSGDERVVAVVEVDGVIDKSRDVVDELHKQIKNDKVKGIVLRVDSPGGAVGPSQEIYDAVLALKATKPIVASMGSVAASGGLYVSVGASKVFAEPGTMTGSIGVIMQLPVYKQIADKIGIQMVTIKSGKLKDVGNSFRDMTDEEREYLESTVKEAHADFISAVASGRKLDRSKVEEFADGRILLGSRAKELGLVDAYGGVYDAARAVSELAGEPLPEGQYPKLYYPRDKYRELRQIFESISRLPSLLSGGFKLQYIAL